jgi:pimeloyl-ACP methyl ester carboxylesterase
MSGWATIGRAERINDIDLYFETQGRGERLLLLHGFTGSGGDWRYVFEAPPRGYELVIPDLRGHGRSTGAEGAFTFGQCALDVAALLDHLGVGRVRAIGLSGGAQTLLHLATRQPERVEAMVLVSTAPYFPDSARAVMSQMTAEGRTEEEWKSMRARHKLGDGQIRSLWTHGNRFQDSYDDVNFTPPSLARITARTLIVHGDLDPLYPVSLPAEMHASIRGSRLWIVPNGGHGPIFGEMARPFVDTALAFLEGQWDKRPGTGPTARPPGAL